MTERVNGSLTYCVLGELRYVYALKTVIRKRNGNVCLSAAEGRLELIVLEEAIITHRCEPEHKLAERYNFHISKILSKIIIFLLKKHMINQIICRLCALYLQGSLYKCSFP